MLRWRGGEGQDVATVVIVHGGWGGGWEWAEVAALLTAGGHRVLTPTLTGLGDRAHLATSERIGLETHVSDVIAVLAFEDLHDVVLCGHSYGGAPVTVVADRVPDRLRSIVYLDAIVPDHGRSVIDLTDPGFRASIQAGLATNGAAWRVPIPAELLPTAGPREARRRYVERLRDHPAATFVDPVELRGAGAHVPRAYVRCVDGPGAGDPSAGDPTRAAVQRARAEGWSYRELVAPHDLQLVDPAGAAATLDQLV